MTRTVVSGVAAFALLIGAALAMNETAEAGHCGGGLFSKVARQERAAVDFLLDIIADAVVGLVLGTQSHAVVGYSRDTIVRMRWTRQKGLWRRLVRTTEGTTRVELLCS